MKKKLVVLTGAGISAESGLKTFRDHDGLWENYRIEDVASIEAWHQDPETVLRFYNERRKNVKEAQLNVAHFGLAELENDFDVHIITQNIDDLHERAGSSKVLHLHGEILKMRSERDANLIIDASDEIHIGDFASDGAQLRPHIVWFGESVPMIEDAIFLMEQADLFVLIGSSLVVYPAAGLISYLPAGIPKYIIDPKMPLGKSDFYCIEKTATEGIEELKNQLILNHKQCQYQKKP